MNFNTFGFLRESCRLLKRLLVLEDDSDDLLYEEDDTNTIENMNAIANGDYWQNLIQNHYNNHEDMKDIEIAFSQKYENELKNLFQFAINIPIKNKTTKMPKYRIYYGTNSTDGLFLMVDQMNRTWKDILRLSSHGQKELFDEKTETSVSSSLKVFTSIDFKTELNNLFVAKCSINMRDFYIHIIEKTGITYSMSEYRQEIKTLEKEKIIKILRKDEKTATGKLPYI